MTELITSDLRLHAELSHARPIAKIVKIILIPFGDQSMKVLFVSHSDFFLLERWAVHLQAIPNEVLALDEIGVILLRRFDCNGIN